MKIARRENVIDFIYSLDKKRDSVLRILDDELGREVFIDWFEIKTGISRAESCSILLLFVISTNQAIEAAELL